MNKKPQYFILVQLAAPVREYAAPSFKERAKEIKEEHNYNFPQLRQAV